MLILIVYDEHLLALVGSHPALVVDRSCSILICATCQLLVPEVFGLSWRPCQYLIVPNSDRLQGVSSALVLVKLLVALNSDLPYWLAPLRSSIFPASCLLLLYTATSGINLITCGLYIRLKKIFCSAVHCHLWYKPYNV